MTKIIRLFSLLIASVFIFAGCATQGGVASGQPSQQFPMVVSSEVPPPQSFCNGRWVPGSCNQGTSIPVGQIVTAGGSLGKCELIGAGAGGLAGYAVGGNHKGVAAFIGAVAGAFAGNQYCKNDAGQVVSVQSGQPQVSNQPRADGKIAAKLNWPDHPKHGQMVWMDPNDTHKGN